MDPGHFAHQYVKQRYHAVRGAFAEALAASRDAGMIHKDTDVRNLARQIVAFMDGTTMQWALEPEGMDLVALYEQYIEFLIANLSTGKRPRSTES